LIDIGGIVGQIKCTEPISTNNSKIILLKVALNTQKINQKYP
jgi:hypothetical protein